jgi:hypothetical protein
MGKGEAHTGFGWGNFRGKRKTGRHKSKWKDNIKMDIQGVGWEAWTGFIWLRIGTGGGLL